MRTKMLGLVALVMGGLGAATAANANPFGFGPGDDDGPRFERAADGCGPGFHLNPWGRCRPNDRGYGYDRGYGPPRAFYGPPREYGDDRGYGPPPPRYRYGY